MYLVVFFFLFYVVLLEFVVSRGGDVVGIFYWGACVGKENEIFVGFDKVDWISYERGDTRYYCFVF